MTIEQIEEKVCKRFGIPPLVIKVKSRHLYIVKPRQIVIKLCRDKIKENGEQISFQKIGEYYGLDRTTAIHSWKLIGDLHESDKFKKIYNELQNEIEKL